MDLCRAKTSGFTLVELMVVIVIVGILAGVVLPQYMKRVDTAIEKRIALDFRHIEEAVNCFKLDTQHYPDAIDQLMRGGDTPNWNGPYLQRQPLDPWKNEYIYKRYEEGPAPFEVITLGADGKEGGTGENRDCSNLELLEEPRAVPEPPGTGAD
jgi:general secretion pathway protein G